MSGRRRVSAIVRRILAAGYGLQALTAFETVIPKSPNYQHTRAVCSCRGRPFFMGGFGSGMGEIHLVTAHKRSVRLRADRNSVRTAFLVNAPPRMRRATLTHHTAASLHTQRANAQINLQKQSSARVRASSTYWLRREVIFFSSWCQDWSKRIRTSWRRKPSGQASTSPHTSAYLLRCHSDVRVNSPRCEDHGRWVQLPRRCLLGDRRRLLRPCRMARLEPAQPAD